ncbi:MAG: 4-hydroxy-3-methylbut-2-enyl diphosphate reductase [Treponema sp.]|jgi:4-hydroxy-3-methylbut-2-enyl diphosphate reductase|nr:4-hydroxy-3-methylbut-2-enyl diphosphate reductase [Treponema sp.]
MKVIKAKVLGFCMGVRRAVDIAAAQAQENSSRVYTLGPLIHNPKALADLEALGIQSIDEDSLSANDCTVIIRAHGVSPAAEQKLCEKGCRVVDATCPRVKTNQLKTQELSRAGFSLFLAGEAEHAEIKGLLGYSGEAPFCIVTGSAEEARETAARLFEKNKNAKTAILGQTTISEEEYKNIAEEIKKYFPDLQIIKTICAATGERQNALRKLLLETEAVIIAGGKESANTRRLLAIARQSGKPCALAENAAQIPSFFRNYEKIGLSAGASTPDQIIDEIERELVSVTEH